MDDSIGDGAAAAVGRAWLGAGPWDLLAELTAIEDRMGGSPGERQAASLVADALREAGVRDVDTQTFGLRRWHRGGSRLELPDRDRTFASVALPYAPEETVTGPLVDVGHGTPEEIEGVDLEGAVALASTDSPRGGRFVHRMEKFGAAVDAGAAGFVFANHKSGQLAPTGSLGFDGEARAPAVGVSKEAGDRLREYARDAGTGGGAEGGAGGESERVRLAVEGRTAAGESRNVLGRLGPETGTELLALAHYDAHDIGEGALDNGCGVATLVAATRVLGAMDLQRGVRVVAVGAEELGLVGSEHLAARLDLEGVAGVVNVDGAGRGRDLVALSHASEATARAAERVADRTGHPVRVDREPHPFSDQWPFVRQGVPALQLHSRTGERGRGWTHTAADTLDKVDRRDLREHAALTALLLRELAAADLPRLDAEDLAGAFRDAEFEPGMRAAGLWPEAWE